MIPAQHLLINDQRTLVQRLCLPIAILEPIEQRQVVEDSGCMDVVQPQHLLRDEQRALRERLGFLITALEPVNLRQIVQAGSGGRVLGPKLLLHPSQLLELQGNRLRIAPLANKRLDLLLLLKYLGGNLWAPPWAGLGGHPWRFRPGRGCLHG